MIYDIDDNYINYCSKVSVILDSGDMDSLTNELILQPNMILSIVIDYLYSGNSRAPLLLQCGLNFTRNGNIKMFELFLNGLLHYGDVILNQSEFLKKYLNFAHTQGIISSMRFVKCKHNVLIYV